MKYSPVSYCVYGRLLGIHQTYCISCIAFDFKSSWVLQFFFFSFHSSVVFKHFMSLNSWEISSYLNLAALGFQITYATLVSIVSLCLVLSERLCIVYLNRPLSLTLYIHWYFMYTWFIFSGMFSWIMWIIYMYKKKKGQDVQPGSCFQWTAPSFLPLLHLYDLGTVPVTLKLKYSWMTWRLNTRITLQICLTYFFLEKVHSYRKD